MSREVRQGCLIPCPKCQTLPTDLVEVQNHNDRTQKWEIETIYRECSNCDYIWDREPPLKPWEV